MVFYRYLWSWMIVHGHLQSFCTCRMQIIERRRRQCVIMFLDLIERFMDLFFELYHRPSGLLFWCWPDIDYSFSSSGTEQEVLLLCPVCSCLWFASQQTLGTSCSFCQSTSSHKRPKWHGRPPHCLTGPKKTAATGTRPTQDPGRICWKLWC